LYGPNTADVISEIQKYYTHVFHGVGTTVFSSSSFYTFSHFNKKNIKLMLCYIFSQVLTFPCISKYYLNSSIIPHALYYPKIHVLWVVWSPAFQVDLRFGNLGFSDFRIAVTLSGIAILEVIFLHMGQG